MKKVWLKISTLAIAVIIVVTVLPACTCQQVSAADSYVAIVPDVLHSGRAESVSLSLLSGGKLVKDNIEVTLLKDNKKITSAKQTVDGTGTVTLNIQQNAEEGKYEIQVKGTGFVDKAPVSVAKSYLVFVETDKPIYKPGQTMKMRVLTLDAELKPISEPATVEVLDAKGIKIFRTEVATD